MNTNFTTYPETAPFVEALRLTLQAEDKTLEGLISIYGEGGDKLYQDSPLREAFTALKREVSNWIGTTFELGITGCLEAKKEV